MRESDADFEKRVAAAKSKLDSKPKKNKQGYTAHYEADEAPTEEEMEAFRKFRARGDDPMAKFVDKEDD